MAVEGMIGPEEAAELFRLAAQVSGDTAVVEIGSYRGRSTTALALGARSGAGAPVYAIDPHEHYVGAFGGRFSPADRTAFFRNLLKAGVVEQVRLVNLPSNQAARAWEHPIGLLWVDGDHTPEGVQRDFQAWGRTLADDGVVAFHDAHAEGPASVIERLLDDGFEQVAAVGGLKALRRCAA